MVETSPLISVVIASRNDNYNGDSLWRLQTALTYLATNLSKLGRLSDVEVVITDWGSPVSLSRALSPSHEARLITRVVVVSPSLAHEVEGDSEFPITLAQNAGIRRSRGTYIAQLDADILVPKDFLEKLFLLLDGRLDWGVPIERALVVAHRRNLPWLLTSGNPSIRQLNWMIQGFGHLMPGVRLDGVPYFGTGLIMMHRDLWEECGGFDEALVYRGAMETDLGNRITQRVPCIHLDQANVHLYHLAHYTAWHAVTQLRKYNLPKPNNIFHPNFDNWGLREHLLEEGRLGPSAEALPDQPEVPDKAQDRLLTLRLGLAVVVLHLRAVLRRSTPEPLQGVLPRFLVAIGHLPLHLRGKPLRRWPILLWNLWLQRQRSRRVVRSD